MFLLLTSSTTNAAIDDVTEGIGGSDGGCGGWARYGKVIVMVDLYVRCGGCRILPTPIEEAIQSELWQIQRKEH